MAQNKNLMSKLKDLDLYLLLEVSPEASEKEIKKAYRKKSLKCHPDKNPDDPKAAETFHQLSEALAILTDETARKAYDNVLKARKANELRNRQLDEKRRKLKDSLEAREIQAANEERNKLFAKKTEEEKFEAEIERVMREGRRELEEEQERIRILIEKEKEESKLNNQGTKIHVEKPTRIKVRWKATSDSSHLKDSLYTRDSLFSIFSKYGDVNVVVVSESSNQKKGSALIEMATTSSADMASKVERGFVQIPLKCKLIEGGPESVCSGNADTPNIQSTEPTSTLQSNSNFNDYETLVLRKMRQAEERKKLEQEILEQDKLEEQS